MYVSDKLKLVYIRVPKTGSSSVCKAIGAVDPGFEHRHWVHARYGDIPADKWDGLKTYRKVGFIRHPLAWLPSFFALCQKHHTHRTAYLTEPRALDAQDASWFLRNLKWTPMDWLTDASGNSAVEVLRTEDMTPFLASIGVRPRYENATRERPVIDWSGDDLAYIGHRFARELAYYPC
jgi:hypothetical protein